MSSQAFLDGGGEMGALMRAKDWSRTPLGPVESWPQSLRTIVSTCLNSRFPILIWWGPQHVKLYNDAYREVIGAKHPHALGRPGRDVWPEIWHIIGPMLDGVLHEGRATWSEDQFLPLERHGWPEECYFTFSYGPIRDESGIGGVFSAVSETTRRVIGERRLRLLQTLAAETAGYTALEVCERATAVLDGDPADVPFALVYLADGDRRALRLAASAGGTIDPALAPGSVSLTADGADASPWPLGRALASDGMILSDAPGSPAQRALVTPIQGSGGSAAGVLVAGLSRMLPVDDQYRGFVGLIAREIGGALAHAVALEHERRRAEALADIDRAKTVFFSNISHEFRTPLTLMLSPLEEALGVAEPALAGDDLASVYRNALRLLKLVNTLLDFARIEAGRARAAIEPTDLPRLTADLASTFRSAMARAGLQFDVECPPLPAPIPVDRDAWEKIVLNLLSNALKFTFSGRVTISLRQRDDRIALEVRDTGAGIPPDEIPRLFDRFHRVHGARARTTEGSGIGLALVNELVKMHGGTIQVESEPGRGTAFTVWIPAVREQERVPVVGRGHDAARPAQAARAFVSEAMRWLPTDEADVAAAAERPTGSSARILLADDNADMREYATRLLADRWAVEAVPDGAAALARVRADRPALVIADVMMPGLDGFELVRALRADPSTRDVPIVLLSARAGEEASIEGLRAGADDYIVKPFSARELRARVEAQIMRGEIRAIEAAHDRRLADIFRHAPVAVAMLRGPDHVYEFANDEYFSVIGNRPLVGKTINDALPELADQGIRELLDSVYGSGQPYTAESLAVTVNRGPGGTPEEVYFNFVYQPVRSRAGDIEGIAVVAVDVTEVVRARNAAETANRAKDHFLAVLGHELRNPLAPILTAAHLLELKGPKEGDLPRLRETISRQATHLLKLVEDLLDVGRIITGKLRLEKKRVELAGIVRNAVEASMPAVNARHHTLDVELPEAAVYVEADAARMTQVLCNLLNNAAKFMADGGRITLTVAAESGMARISVRDQGIGIPTSMLDRVFDRFVQASADDSAPSTSGLGIGLSVVKSVVELHGGTVLARSNGPGTGSEFTVRLPVAAAVASTATYS